MASTSELSNNSKSQSIVTKVLDATPDSNSTSSSASQDLSKQQQQQKTTTTSPINFEEAEAVAAQSLLQAAYSINLSHRSDRNGPSNPSTTAVSTSVLNGNRLVASSSASSTGDINVVSSFNKFGGYSYSKGSPIPAVQSSTSAENSDVQAGKKRGGNDSDEKGKGKEKKARKSVADDVEEDEEEDDMVGSEEGSQSKITSSSKFILFRGRLHFSRVYLFGRGLGLDEVEINTNTLMMFLFHRTSCSKSISSEKFPGEKGRLHQVSCYVSSPLQPLCSSLFSITKQEI